MKNIRQIVDKFQDVTDINIMLEQPTDAEAAQCHPLLRLALPDGTRLGPFEVLYTPTIDNQALDAVIRQTYKTHHRAIVATPALTAEAAHRLREDNIPYLDAAGNACINERGAFILVNQQPAAAQKRAQEPGEDAGNEDRRAPTRAFKPAGLKMIFALLQDPDLIGQPYREIAKRAGVALGTIRYALDDLEQLGFAQTTGKHRRLLDLEQLARRWVQAYNERLRPKLIARRFTTTQELRNWAPEQLADLPALWGGETAGAEMTGFLKPGGATIYVAEPVAPTIGRLQQALGLKTDPRGEIEILEAFWPAETNMGGGHNAPPLVVYADLIGAQDARLRETAEILYEKYLAGRFRQD